MNKNSLGDRMKRYEASTRFELPPRIPMIIRLDGKSFHTFTKRFRDEGPWSTRLRDALTAGALALLEEISGSKIAYIQSDEISLLVTDDDTLNMQPWFGKGLSKVLSVSASIFTAAFNRALRDLDVPDAYFDARAFVLPWEEVNNCFLWRQQDASKNSVAMLAQANFSHKSLQGKNGSQMQDMLMLEKGVNWNDLPTWQKRGWCVRKGLPDWEIPIFSKEPFYVTGIR